MFSRQVLRVCASCARQSRIAAPKSRQYITRTRPQAQHAALGLWAPFNAVRIRAYVTQTEADLKIEELQELYAPIPAHLTITQTVR